MCGLAFSALAEGNGGGHGHDGGAAAHAAHVAAVAAATSSSSSHASAAVAIVDESAAAAAAVAAETTMLGIAASLGAAIVYGTVYSLAELVMSDARAPHPATLATYVGLGVSGVLGVFLAFAVLPRWGEVAEAVAAANLMSWAAIVFCFGILMLSALLHAIAYYSLLPTVGSAAVGLLNSARAVGVFVFSALLFCSWQHQQCLTAARVIATIVVLGGIAVFNHGKELKHADAHHASSPNPSDSRVGPFRLKEEE